MVCRQRRSDVELTRAGRSPDGQWYVGRGSGRGLWWCTETRCGERLALHHAQKALRTRFDEAAEAAWEKFAQGVKSAVVVKE